MHEPARVNITSIGRQCLLTGTKDTSQPRSERRKLSWTAAGSRNTTCSLPAAVHVDNSLHLLVRGSAEQKGADGFMRVEPLAQVKERSNSAPSNNNKK